MIPLLTPSRGEMTEHVALTHIRSVQNAELIGLVWVQGGSGFGVLVKQCIFAANSIAEPPLNYFQLLLINESVLSLISTPPISNDNK